MLERESFHRIYRASAWYDLWVSTPFALAPVVALVWPLFDLLQQRMTGRPLPPLDPHGMLFANFFGSVVLVWSLVRLRYDDPRLARFDAVGRVLFTIAMLRALAYGAMPLLYGFVVVEAVFGLLQLAPVRGSAWSEGPITEAAR
ncbi:MAG: hypothetical protein U0230_20350 [Polyangiales bacterium]